ncbi:hypothetical protein SLE2022_190820 [Rubroshorea leprosula]
MKKRSLGFLLAVILILLIGEVLEAAFITGGSISTTSITELSTTSIAEFIGHEEFLMESEINARLLGPSVDVCADIYRTVKDKKALEDCYSSHQGNGKPIRCVPERGECSAKTSTRPPLLW